MLNKLLKTLQPFHANSKLFFPAMEATHAKGSKGLQLIERAYRVAETAHSGVSRYTGEEYLTHPCMSAIILNVYGGIDDAETIGGVLDHDVEEDHGNLWPHARLAIEVSPGVAEIASWCNKHRFDSLPYNEEERELLFLQNLLMVGPRPVGLVKIAEQIHNCITPWPEKLANERWVTRKVLLARTIYAMMAKKHSFLYHELLAAADALERGECLLPSIPKITTALE